MSHRFACDGPMHGLEVLQSLAHTLREELGDDLGQPLAIGHGDGIPDPHDPIDLELGWLRDAPVDDLEARLGDRIRQSFLAPEPSAIVVIRRGDPRFTHDPYAALARWMEVHERRPAGPMREVFVSQPTDPAALDEAVVELQLPVAAAVT